LNFKGGLVDSKSWARFRTLVGTGFGLDSQFRDGFLALILDFRYQQAIVQHQTQLLRSAFDVKIVDAAAYGVRL
jgi:hypothetical protein